MAMTSLQRQLAHDVTTSAVTGTRMSLRAPYETPAAGDDDSDGEVYRSPKQFQEEINRRILSRDDEFWSLRERDPPPTADPQTLRMRASVRRGESLGSRLLSGRKVSTADQLLAKSHNIAGSYVIKPLHFNMPHGADVTAEFTPAKFSQQMFRRNDVTRHSNFRLGGASKRSNVEVSKCDGLGLNSGELSDLRRVTRDNVNIVPRPVARLQIGRASCRERV